MDCVRTPRYELLDREDEVKTEFDIEFMMYIHSNENKWSIILMKLKTGLNRVREQGQLSSLPIVISCQRWLSGMSHAGFSIDIEVSPFESWCLL